MIIASQQEKNRRGSLSLLSLEKRGRVMMVSRLVMHRFLLLGLLAVENV
jgi:hypothetical protein